MNYEKMTTEQLKRHKARVEEELQAAHSDTTLTRGERADLIADLRSILSGINEALWGFAPSDSDGVY